MLTLPDIFRSKLIPWSAQNAAERFIVARPNMRQAEMPSGVQLLPQQIQSPRIVIKNKRCYNNARNIMAQWPEAGLHELGKYALICVLDGNVDYPVGNYKLRCGAGYFIFIPPGTPHPDGSRPYVDMEKSTFCDIITFLLHPHALECWMSHGFSQGRERSNNCLILHSQAISLFQMLADEIHGKKNKNPHISQGLLSVFLNVMQREINIGNFQRTRMKNQLLEQSTAPSQTAFTAQLAEYVESNLREPLTLETVSREMYLSTAQFARNMRRETGKSFNQYLAEHRLAKSKDLLRHSEWTISAIADLAGFQSVSYFCSFFKHHVSMTPSEYRTRSVKKRHYVKN